MGIIRQIINFFNHVPSHEDMDKDPIFRSVFLRSPLKTPEKTKSFLWICYLSMRATAFAGMICLIYPLFMLLDLEIFNDKSTLFILRIFCFMTSVPILIFIIPYYYHRIKKEVGFEGIDYFLYTDTQEKTVSFVKHKRFFPRSLFVLISAYFSIIFGYIYIYNILKHYGVFLEFEWLFFSLLAYSLISNPFCSALVLLAMIKRAQLKKYLQTDKI